MKAVSLKDLTKNMRDDQVSGESKEKMQAMIKKMGAERLSTASIPSDLKLKNIKIDTIIIINQNKAHWLEFVPSSVPDASSATSVSEVRKIKLNIL